MSGFLKRVSVIFVLLSFCFCLWPQSPVEVSVPVLIKPDIEGLNQNLDSLELIWSQLIIDNQNLKDSLEQSENSQEKLWSMYQENKTYSLKVETLLKKSEHRLKIWKNMFFISSGLFLVSTTTLFVVIWRNK